MAQHCPCRWHSFGGCRSKHDPAASLRPEAWIEDCALDLTSLTTSPELPLGPTAPAATTRPGSSNLRSTAVTLATQSSEEGTAE